MTNSIFLFIGNHLTLDFINTKMVDLNGDLELLPDFDHLLNWFVKGNVLNIKEARIIYKRWHNKPEAKDAIQLALEFRNILFHLVKRITDKNNIQTTAIKEINRVLLQENEYSYLNYTQNKFCLITKLKIVKPVHLLVPLAQQAADLLCNIRFSQIKKCENPKCVLYFYDNSKNGKRRWCRMDSCGNRQKASNYYKKHISKS